MFDTLVEYQGSKVLIDTWWNVNALNHPLNHRGIKF